MPNFRRSAPLLLVAALALLTGCAAPLDGAKVAIASAVSFYDTAEPKLVTEYAAAQADCLAKGYAPSATEACVAAVRQQWAPIRTAATSAFVAITGAEGALHLAEAATAIGQTPDLGALAAALAQALEAADKMRRAILTLPGYELPDHPATPLPSSVLPSASAVPAGAK